MKHVKNMTGNRIDDQFGRGTGNQDHPCLLTKLLDFQRFTTGGRADNGKYFFLFNQGMYYFVRFALSFKIGSVRNLHLEITMAVAGFRFIPED